MSSWPLLSSSTRARKVVAGALIVATTIALCAAAACSFLVNDSLPAGYACLPDAAMACPPSQVCAPSAVGAQYTCVNKCVVGSDDCLPTEICDTSGWCIAAAVDAGPMDAGTPAPEGGPVADAASPDAGSPCSTTGCRCTTTANCPTINGAGLSCVDRAAVTDDIWNVWTDSGVGAGDGTGAGLCVQPCCTSSDCGSDGGVGGGFVCFGTGAGGNYCVPPEWLPGRSAIGTSGGGAACTDGTDCRSGLCQSGICVDTCCSNRSQQFECATTSICRFNAFPGMGFDTHYTARCSPTPGNQQVMSGGGNCTMNSDCRSNLCVTTGGSTTCRDACRNSVDCVVPTTGPRNSIACQYSQPPSAGTDIVASCGPVTNGGAGGGGGGGGNTGSDGGPAVCFAKADCVVTGSSYCGPMPTRVGVTTYSALTCGQ
ncbi:MAG TPA: hypothetical protein VGM06_21365 [Polyangiaceae bacterium]